MITFTLKQLYASDFGPDGWENLVRFLGPNYGDDTPITIDQIIESEGLMCALWAFKDCADNGNSLTHQFALDSIGLINYLDHRRHRFGEPLLFIDARSLRAIDYAKALDIGAEPLMSEQEAAKGALVARLDIERGPHTALTPARAYAAEAVYCVVRGFDVSAVSYTIKALSSTGDPEFDGKLSDIDNEADRIRNALAALLTEYCNLGHRPSNSMDMLDEKFSRGHGKPVQYGKMDAALIDWIHRT